MKLTSTPTKIFLLLSIAIAFAFGGENPPFYLSLNTNQIYTTASTNITVRMEATPRSVTRIHFRAYRIDDPVDFFMRQEDPHSPMLAIEKPNTFDMLREGLNTASRDAHLVSRDVMPGAVRRTIRDVADLNGVKHRRDSTTVRRTGTLLAPLPGYQIETEWDYDCQPASDTNDRWVYNDVAVPLSKRGVFLIEASARGKRAVTALVISDVSMIIKQSDGMAMAFVIDRRTGAKVSSFPLTFARNGTKLVEESTDGDGVAQVDIPPVPKQTESETEDEDQDSWQWRQRQRQLLVLGEKDGNFVISDPWGGYEYGETNKVYLHTDRPVYRPGQTVYYRGISRLVQKNGQYRTKSGDTVFIAISDARDNTFARDTLHLSEMGTFSGQVVLADEPPLGSYTIKVTIGGDDSRFDFSVEEYKKPEYKVVVTTDRQKYIRGDVINATVKADYFFGSPVANAQVEYFVYRSRYWRPWWEGSDWAYLYGEDGDDDFSTYRMEMVNSGTGTLNPDGTFAISYETDGKADEDYSYRVEANVVDNSRRSISGAKSVVVTRGSFYISVNTDKYVYKPGEEARVNVKIATFDGEKPVATRFTAHAVKRWWVKDTANPSSGMTQHYIEHVDTLWRGTGATDATGHGSIVYKPDSAGYFSMEIIATDERGTVIRESDYIYVASESYANWYHEGSGDVQIIPDKQSYQPGETMNALVVMPAAGMDALITAEGNTIYAHQVERLNSTSSMIHMEIKDEFAPTFFVNVSAIVNDQMYSESKRVPVIPRGKMLHLEVKTDKAIYKPRDKGTVMVRALDEQNEPVKDVDIAVGMVDEAVYSIEPDATPNIQKFFYGYRWNQVQTSASLEFNFYGVRVRERGPNGEVMMSGGAVNPASPLASRSVASRDHIAFGDVKGTMFVEPTVRKDFKDLMFWTPSVRTDADGWAKMSVDFPDNLTTWRITAHGVTEETAVGEAVARVIARKDLLVRMETPRFMVQGDELLIATTIHNYLPSGKLTKVEFSGQNVVLDAKERTVDIPANGEQRIDWKIKAPATGTAKLTVKALTNQESDAMELTLPVLPRGMRTATGTAADMEEQTGSRTMNFTLPESSDPTTGNIYVTLSPSLAGSIINALDELIGYPYGCVEQTMSRFLPTVLVDNTLKQLDIPFDPAKRAAIPRMVGKGLMRLYGMQHKDGGWGWWVDDSTNAFMTAYVMYGLATAKATGYTVLDEHYNGGLRALRASIESGLMDNHPIDPTSRAYQLFVMSMINRNAPQEYLLQRITSLARVDTLNNYGRALLALAAEYQNDRTLAMTLVSQLERSATTNGDYTSWRGRTWHYDWQNDEVETSAAVVKAILDLRGETDLAKRGIRWLLAQKHGSAWDNTRQTAMVIYSLADYLKASRELNPNYTVTVRVNGRQVFTKQITRADVFKAEEKIHLERSALRPGVNTVTIDKNGGGRLYATSEMVYYATGAAIKPNSAGFRVSREYFTLSKEKRGDIYVYNKRPFTGTVKTGDELFVRVQVIPDASYTYFMLEDPLPAGCEVVTKTDGYTIAGESEYDEQARSRNYYYDDWYWWYSYREVHDQKISFFADDLWPRSYEFSYILRAQIPGTYAVMPSTASLMYYPEVCGNGSLASLTITP